MLVVKIGMVGEKHDRRASVRNSCSMAMASVMIRWTVARMGTELKRRQAKSVCIPSTREISSLENVRLGHDS